MTMSLQQKSAVRMFGKYSLVIPPKLKFHQDGVPGKRVLFITDYDENFIVSFEEGMRLLDMVDDHPEEKPTISFQCCKDDKYIHQRRTDPRYRQDLGNWAFFHMELDDNDGSTLHVPGQMTAKAGYQWSDGIEPILMELLDGISVIDEQDSGNDELI